MFPNPSLIVSRWLNLLANPSDIRDLKMVERMVDHYFRLGLQQWGTREVLEVIPPADAFVSASLLQAEVYETEWRNGPSAD